MKMMRYIFIFIFALLLYSSSTAQTLTYTEANAMGPFDPYQYAETRGNANRIFSLIYEGLYRYDYNRNEYIPTLARSIEELSSTDNTYRIQLRNDVSWHDGERFTAEDVVFTYNYIMNSARFALLRDFYGSAVESISQAGDYSVDIQFSSRFPEIRQYLDTWILPSHMFNTETYQGSSDFMRDPIGTGKYEYVSRAMGGVIEFAENQNHYLYNPSINAVLHDRQPDVDTRLSRLITEQTDLLVEIPPSSIGEVEANENLVLVPYQTYSITTIGFNFNNPILAESRIRHAITYATDRQQILESWYEGRGYLLAGPYTRNSQQINSELRPFEFNPERARRLFESAGFTQEYADGILTNASGEALEFTMLVKRFEGATDQTKQNVIVDFQDMMNDVGVRINVETREGDTYLNERQSGQFDLIFAELTFDPNYDILPLFHSDQIEQEDGFNFISYRNEEVDMLFDRYSASMDVEERQQYINRIQTIIAEDSPYMFMFSVNRHAAHLSRLFNIEIDPLYFFSDIDKWEMR